MPALSTPNDAEGHTATSALFGGNVLAPRTAMEGSGSYAEAINDLGVTGLRYPGGSLTEYYFDISNPDTGRATHAQTGEETDFIPLSDFMTYAGSEGHPVTIVVPTRDQLSSTETDEKGDRMPEIDEAELRGFVQDVVAGAYGDAEIAAFELGNEYWGSGEMNAAEYGRLAAEMTKIIDSELESISIDHPEAAGIDIIAQMGHNYNFSQLSNEYENTGMSNEEILTDLSEIYGLDLSIDTDVYGSGEIKWQHINNKIIVKELVDADAIDDVDGVVAHVYSRGEDIPYSRYHDMSLIEKNWTDDRPDIDIHVTEWNQKSTDSLDPNEDYGLYQAHEMLNVMESFMQSGVEQAHVWPLIQNTRNALGEKFDYDNSTVAGKMFSMMSETLPGKTMLDFQPGDRETEAEIGDLDVHGFTGDGELVFYIASTAREGVTETDLDISNLVADFGSMNARVLGVKPGDAPGSTRNSDPDIEGLDADLLHDDGFLDIVLDPGEIMEIRIGDVTPTDAFAPVFESVNGSAETDPEVPMIPDKPEEDEEEFEEDTGTPVQDSDDPTMGMEWALAILPLLALVGMAVG